MKVTAYGMAAEIRRQRTALFGLRQERVHGQLTFFTTLGTSTSDGKSDGSTGFEITNKFYQVGRFANM